MTDFVTPRRMARVKGVTPDGEKYDLVYPMVVDRNHPGYRKAPDLFMVASDGKGAIKMHEERRVQIPEWEREPELPPEVDDDFFRTTE